MSIPGVPQLGKCISAKSSLRRLSGRESYYKEEATYFAYQH